MKSHDWTVVWTKLVDISLWKRRSAVVEKFSFLAEAINRSFTEIKSYVDNRQNNLLQSLKTTRDYKLKVLNDQLNVILSKAISLAEISLCI